MVSSFRALSFLFLFALTSCGNDKGYGYVGESSLRMFYTQFPAFGNMSGVSGADGRCMSDNFYPGTGTFKALLVDGSNRVACTTANCSGGTSEHVDWVLKPNTTYVRVDNPGNLDGPTIGTTDSKGLFSFPLLSPFGPDAHLSWHGLNNDWTTSSNTCSAWTDSNSTGSYGMIDSDTVTAINYGSSGCNGSSGIPNAYLICVEQ
jgi:hypothetical protein